MKLEIDKQQKSVRKVYTLAPRLVGRPEAAHYLGVGTTKFDEMVRDRLIPSPIEIGSRRLYDVLDLDRVIDDLKDAGSAVLVVAHADEWQAVA